jgi:hypothetical protein
MPKLALSNDREIHGLTHILLSWQAPTKQQIGPLAKSRLVCVGFLAARRDYKFIGIVFYVVHLYLSTFFQNEIRCLVGNDRQSDGVPGNSSGQFGYSIPALRTSR